MAHRHIIIEIEGGVVHDIKKPDDCEVIIRDYDTEGVEDERVTVLPDGQSYVETVY